VIRPFEDLQRGARDRSEERTEEVELGELVARSLKEQHRDRDLGKMRAALDGRAPGGVEREAEEDEPSYPFERLARRRQRGHAPAHRLAPGEERQVRGGFGSGAHGGANGRLEHRRRIGRRDAFCM
jgi:hypothetical protein